MTTEHVVDLSANPFIPDGYTVDTHSRGDSFTWDPSAIEFYLSEPQRVDDVIEGNHLIKELEDKPVLNANILDYLLARSYLIPEEWKKDEKGRARYIFFWGTIYRDSDGRRSVRGLYWDGSKWDWSSNPLDRWWNITNPAALLAH